ncbi:MAG: ankyrin repeat domain-containing protein, partial [bacterium]|nr:ankyrin repeat domain-containing protein [bacterium]
ARNDTGATPLHDATLAGRRRVVEMLLNHGAAIDDRGRETGSTPLHLAASWDRYEVAELLLRRGADPAAVNHKGQNALKLALDNGHSRLAALIREYQTKD